MVPWYQKGGAWYQQNLWKRVEPGTSTNSYVLTFHPTKWLTPTEIEITRYQYLRFWWNLVPDLVIPVPMIPLSHKVGNKNWKEITKWSLCGSHLSGMPLMLFCVTHELKTSLFTSLSVNFHFQKKCNRARLFVYYSVACRWLHRL